MIELLPLFAIMVVLAATPSASVALVVTRAATLGTANGVAAAAGIVLGDIVFIMLAILGLSMVAETLGGLFVVIRYLGATYLLWLGFSLLTANGASTLTASKPRGKGSLIAGFLAGFFLTLGDIKAVFFYASLFPVFIDLSALQANDILALVLVTIISVGGVKLFYVFSATKVAALARGFRYEKAVRKTAGGLVIGAGGYLIVKT